MRTSQGIVAVLGMMLALALPHPARGADTPEKKDRFTLNDLLPMAWQNRPQVRFNVYTEMTPAGRERPSPTPEKPLCYFAPPGTYAEMGWQISAGEKPPPWRELEESMRKALAANHYRPIADDGQRPDLLVVFAFGSFSTDLAQIAVVPMPLNGEPPPDYMMPVIPPPITAEELLAWLFPVIAGGEYIGLRNPLYDRKAVHDVLDRARFIGGPKIAEELRIALRFEANYRGPEEMSPVRVMLHGSGGATMRHVVELAFKTCYFVTATAFDFNGVEKKQKITLWQTRMTVEAQGVEMGEILKPLIVNTGSFLGRETPETVIVTNRIDREGRVQIGEAKVVPDTPAPPNEPKKWAPESQRGGPTETKHEPQSIDRGFR